MAGYIRHSLRSTGRDSLDAQPAWTRTVYPAGVGILIFMQLLLGLVGWDGAAQVGTWLLGVIASLLTFGLIWATPRFRILNPVRANWTNPSASQEAVVYGVLGAINQFFSQISTTISNTLEGDSGLMWTLLFLILFVSLLNQGGL